jgi:hypothetical protein
MPFRHPQVLGLRGEVPHLHPNWAAPKQLRLRGNQPGERRTISLLDGVRNEPSGLEVWEGEMFCNGEAGLFNLLAEFLESTSC